MTDSITKPAPWLDTFKSAAVLRRIAASPLYRQLIDEDRQAVADRRRELLAALAKGIKAEDQRREKLAIESQRADAAADAAHRAWRVAMDAATAARVSLLGAEAGIGKRRGRIEAELHETADGRIGDVWSWLGQLHNDARMALDWTGTEDVGHGRTVVVFNTAQVEAALGQLRALQDEAKALLTSDYGSSPVAALRSIVERAQAATAGLDMRANWRIYKAWPLPDLED